MVPIYSIDDAEGVARAIDALRAGEAIAFPTDTLYGVGGDALSPQAVRRVQEAKRRDKNRAMPVLLAGGEDARLLVAEWPELAARLAGRYWPGALTLVVPSRPEVPDGVRSGGTVAVRVPGHAALRELIARAGCPLIGTSANLSGEPATLTANEASRVLGESVTLVLDGGRVGGAPSTVVLIEGNEVKVLREGAIAATDVLRVSRE